VKVDEEEKDQRIKKKWQHDLPGQAFKRIGRARARRGETRIKKPGCEPGREGPSSACDDVEENVLLDEEGRNGDEHGRQEDQALSETALALLQADQVDDPGIGHVEAGELIGPGIEIVPELEGQDAVG
jgi:hypothetical protein